MRFQLQPRITEGARVETSGEETWRLVIPPEARGKYRLAQMDNYYGVSRTRFPHQAPFTLELRARVSAPDLPGTWGFGLWNDPFGFGLGMGGAAARFPALPNAAWFFHASEPNYLALRDTHPAQGFLAATFRSPLIPAAFLLLAAPGALFLTWPAAARLLRRLARRIVREDALKLDLDVTAWCDYRLEWLEQTARFWVDGTLALETPFSPLGQLGLVIWIDNQYAAFPPDGRLRSGTLANSEEAWLEFELL
jgi:hypothetical protein